MADIAVWASAAAAATLFGLTGFGDAVIFISLMSIVSAELPVSTVVALTAVLTSADNGMGVCLAFKDLTATNVRRLLALCSTGLCMVPVGLLALRKLDQASIQLVVGTGLLAFALWRLGALAFYLWTPPCQRSARQNAHTCSGQTAMICTRALGCAAPASPQRQGLSQPPPQASPGGGSASPVHGDTAIAAVGRVALGMETPSVGPYTAASGGDAASSCSSAGGAAAGWHELDAVSVESHTARASRLHRAGSGDSDDPANCRSGSPAPHADAGSGQHSAASSPAPAAPAGSGDAQTGVEAPSLHDSVSEVSATAMPSVSSPSPRHRGAEGACAGDMPALQLPATAAPTASAAAHALDPVSHTWTDAPVEEDTAHGHAARPGWVCCSVTACDRTIPLCGLPVFSRKELLGEFKRLRWDADARWETYVLLLCGLVAGVAGGSIGINGPPIVVAFTVLKARLSKDDMRSISVSYFFLELMVVRLPLLVSSGLLNVSPVTAAGIVGAALLGLGTGSAFRSYVDTDKIILVLVMLVFASAWLMTLSAAGAAAAGALQATAIALSALLAALLGGGAWAHRWEHKQDQRQHSRDAVVEDHAPRSPKKAPSSPQLHAPGGATAVPEHAAGSDSGPLDPPLNMRSTTV